MFSAETTGPIFTKILHDIVALVQVVAKQNLAPSAELQRMHVVSVYLHTAKLFGCHGNALDKLENEVQIQHLHVKRFHTVNRLQKLVRYIQRYLTKYVEPDLNTQRNFHLLSCSPPKLDLYQNFTRYSGISGAI